MTTKHIGAKLVGKAKKNLSRGKKHWCLLFDESDRSVTHQVLFASDFFSMFSNIGDFYQGKNILLIGSTSFPGKVLLEKLLRSCPQINRIYCPVRRAASDHLSAEDIFAEIYTTKLFDHVRRENGKFQEKILPFDSNCLLLLPSSSSSTVENETIDENPSKLIQEKIDLCFYIANHSLDFGEQNLKDMIQRNVIELKHYLNFLKTCTQLQSIVYLSSIYANIGWSLTLLTSINRFSL